MLVSTGNSPWQLPPVPGSNVPAPIRSMPWLQSLAYGAGLPYFQGMAGPLKGYPSQLPFIQPINVSRSQFMRLLPFEVEMLLGLWSQAGLDPQTAVAMMQRSWVPGGLPAVTTFLPRY